LSTVYVSVAPAFTGIELGATVALTWVTVPVPEVAVLDVVPLPAIAFPLNAYVVPVEPEMV
jgi:hypothetical protein